MNPPSCPKMGEHKRKGSNAHVFVLGIIISLLVTYLHILGTHDWNQGLFFWLQSQQAPNPAWSSLFRVNIFSIWKERLPSEGNISWTASPNGLTNTYKSLIPRLLSWLWQPSLARAIPKPRKPRARVRWAQGWLRQSERRNTVPTALTQLSGSGFETSAQQRWFSSWLLFIYWKLLLVTQKEKQLKKACITQFYIRQDHYGQLQAYKKNMYWKAPKSKQFFLSRTF